MKIFIVLAFAFAVVLGLIFAPPAAVMATTIGGEPPIPRQFSNNAVVPGQYIVTLKNETFAEVDEQFPDKEKVTASNIPEENAQVNPAMKRQFDAETAEIVFQNVQAINGSTPEEYPTSPLGEQGAVIGNRDIFTHAIKGYAVNGVDNPSIFLGNENISTVEQSHYAVPAAQYLPNAMNRGDSDKMDSPGCKIDNREGNCNVDLAIIDGKVYPHPDLNLFQQFNALDSGWTPGPTTHGMGNAGVCCARDNLGGVVGSAPGARIWSIIFFGAPPGSPDASTVSDSIQVRALNYVAANAASIEVANWNVQCGSMGGGGNTCPMVSAKNTAANSVVSAGVTLTNAAGNANVDIDGWEYCVYSASICVGAYGDMDGLCGGKSTYTYGGTGKDDQIAIFSNWGDSVDIAGPGYTSLSVRQPIADVDGSMTLSGFPSTTYHYIGNSPHGSYQTYSGTSQANPTVSGIAAVIKANNPSFTPAQVRSALLADSVPITEGCDGSSKGGYTNGAAVGSQKNAPLAYAGDY